MCGTICSRKMQDGTAIHVPLVEKRVNSGQWTMYPHPQAFSAIGEGKLMDEAICNHKVCDITAKRL